MSDRPNLPHHAYRNRPLAWGAPPPGGAEAIPGDSIIPPPGSTAGDGALSGGLNSALSPVTFSFNDVASGTINSAYPKFIRVATQNFVTAIGLVNVDLSTSIANLASDGVAGIAVAKDQGAVLSVVGNTNLDVCHVCTASAAHSMRSGVSFADEV